MLNPIFVNSTSPRLDNLIDIHTLNVKKPVKSHSHDFLELAYIKNGHATHTINGKTTLVKKGDYIIVDYGISHSYNVTSTDLEITNLLFKPSIIDTSLKACKSLKTLLNNYMINIGYTLSYPYIYFDEIFHDSDNTIQSLLDKISREYYLKHMGYIQIIRSNLIEIIIQTTRQLEKTQHSTLKKEDPLIQEVITEIQKNFLSDIKLCDLAKKFNISTSQLSRNFYTATGYKFSEYLQVKKIEHACILLVNTNYKISEVAFDSGYNDIKYFNEVFKRTTHLTPTQYRKS